MASNYQLSYLRPGWELNPSLRGGRREYYGSATEAPNKRGNELVSGGNEIVYGGNEFERPNKWRERVRKW